MCAHALRSSWWGRWLGRTTGLSVLPVLLVLAGTLACSCDEAFFFSCLYLLIVTITVHYKMDKGEEKYPMLHFGELDIRGILRVW